jgi:hypothetical protein
VRTSTPARKNESNDQKILGDSLTAKESILPYRHRVSRRESLQGAISEGSTAHFMGFREPYIYCLAETALFEDAMDFNHNLQYVVVGTVIIQV